MQARESTVRPQTSEEDQPLYPVDVSLDGRGKEFEKSDEKLGKEEQQWEDLASKYEALEKKVAEYVDDQETPEPRDSPVVKTPSTPTKEEYQRHQVTHTPYAFWCRHCAAARKVRDGHPSKGRRKHIVSEMDGKLVGPTKISLDYMYLHERSDAGKDESQNPPHLVAIEHKFGRVWAYRVPNKGTSGGAAWLPRRFIQDWDNNGMKDAVIQLKTDQEPSIVQLQIAIQEIRTVPMIPVNSPVGESESNGRVENAIGRVQDKIRALRDQVEHNTKQKIKDD